MKKESHTVSVPISGMTTSNNRAQRAKCTAYKTLSKYSSNIEVTVILTVKTADDKGNIVVNAFFLSYKVVQKSA